MTTDPELMTVREAARLLRVGKNLAYELVHRGDIPAIRVGRMIRVPRAALVAWIDEQSRIPASADEPVPHDATPPPRPATDAVEPPEPSARRHVDLEMLGATLLEPRRADAEKGSSMK